MGKSGNESVRVLVVDHDRQELDRIGAVLRSEGFQCESSTSAARALVSARSHMPSLMILEVQLDACSGFEFAQTVKQEYPRQDIPVIFIAQSRGSEIIDESRRAGGTYCLSKPIDPSVLVELVDKALWMPHLVRRHIDNAAHSVAPKAPRVLIDGNGSAASVKR